MKNWRFYFTLWVSIQQLAVSFATAQKRVENNSFFPLQIGNTWILRYLINPGQHRDIVTVSDTVTIAHKKYFIVNLWPEQWGKKRYFREDTAGGFYELRDTVEIKLMDFKMVRGDSLPLYLKRHPFVNPPGYTVCRERKATTTVGGKPGEEISFLFDYAIGAADEEQVLTLQSGFGISTYRKYIHDQSVLVGALVNGVVYGDTSLISAVKEIAEKKTVEEGFFQNHPNPFNPETTLTFELTKLQNVGINIFSIEGRLVRSFALEMLNPGRHSITWAGKDNQNREVDSGTFFCILKTNEHVFRRKLTLVK